MNEKHSVPPAPGLNLADIYHVLFRHKWKILVVWAVGLVAAAALWLAWPVPYKSEAELFVRYILDNKSPSTVGNDSSIQTPNLGGANILGSEVEILNSFDLALQVADAVGPEPILAKAGGGTDRIQAAGLIHRGLTIGQARNSAIIQIIFRHPDGNIVQPVLNQLISSYFKRHAEIHGGAGGLDDVLMQQTDQLRVQLQQTEQDLRKAKSQVGVISLDETKKSYTARIEKIQEDLSSAQAELAEREAALGEMTNLMSTQISAKSDTNFSSSMEAPSEKLAEYKSVCGLLDSLGKKEQELRLLFPAENLLVQEVHGQLAENEKIKARLETEYPQLVGSHVVALSNDSQQGTPAFNVTAELMKAKSLQARIRFLNQQLADIGKQIASVDAMEGTISDLQRKFDLLQQNYTHFSASLNNARFDEALGSGRISNISTVQMPTPPAKDMAPLKKAVMMLLAGVLAAGVALAFVIELYLDRSFKRPIEIETKLGLPLFLSIPRSAIDGKSSLGDAVQTQRLLTTGHAANENESGEDIPAAAQSETAPWQDDHSLRSYFEALRDRLLVYFEVQNLTHKPKLVAVTSCAEGSGVSTIAGGLAACLSETGDGNVLLVDMNNVERGAARYFHKGKLECGLDDALVTEKRDSAMVQDNLYVVAETVDNDKLPRILHKRFSSLMPKLRASDYDYIIFDMPPVSQISPTTRVARFMDMVFMVVEAEKTDREVVKRATALLAESKARVGVVLNKSHTYVPRRLQQEL